MRKMLLVLLLIVAASGIGFAQWRADMGLDVVSSIGVSFETETGTQTEALDVLSNVIVPLPDFSVAYEARLGPVNLGAGGRMFTLLLESVIYPNVFAEVQVGPIVGSLNVGGGLFMTFGLFTTGATGGQLANISTQNFYLPDIAAAVQLGESFRLGAGMLALVSDQIQGTLPYLFYLNGKFLIRW